MNIKKEPVFKRESDFENATIPFLEDRFIEYKWQVPIANRLIDFVGLDVQSNLVGIEYKLKDWRRALFQARRNYISLDYVYICIPEGNYSEELLKQARDYGVGILIYNYETSSISEYLVAKKNERKWRPVSDTIKNYILG